MSHHPDDPELVHARAWLLASRADGHASRALEAIYNDTSNEIQQRGPACWASGRCCNFTKTGHLLYVTGLEAAYCVARAPRPGPGSGSGPGPSPHALSLPQIQLARTRGDCPFLDGNLCNAHTIKPLGCRVYFCDRSAQLWQQDLSERMLARVRSIHEAHALEYRYGEWRSMLELVTAANSL
jgi:Fe-S-cluster containining protein